MDTVTEVLHAALEERRTAVQNAAVAHGIPESIPVQLPIAAVYGPILHALPPLTLTRSSAAVDPGAFALQQHLRDWTGIAARTAATRLLDEFGDGCWLTVRPQTPARYEDDPCK